MMTPDQIRNANFEGLRAALDDRRREVYEAFVELGPCTTRQLADGARLDILSVRPRASELLELGLLSIAGHIIGPTGKREGVYEATAPEEWRKWHQQQFPTGAQIQMGLNAVGALTT